MATEKGKRIFWLYLISAIIHSASFIAQIVIIAVQSEKIGTFKTRLTYVLNNEIVSTGDLEPIWFIPTFTFITIFFCIYYMVNAEKIVENHGVNMLRGPEYAITAGLMYMPIALLSRITDAPTLLLILVGNITTQILGTMHEVTNKSVTKAFKESKKTEEFKKVDWSHYIVACIPFIATWIIVLFFFNIAVDASNEQVPVFVYLVVYGLLASFSSFAIVTLFHYIPMPLGTPSYKEFLLDGGNYEFAMGLNSLLAKLALVWTVFIGLLTLA